MDTRLRLGKRYQLLERIGSGGMGIVYRAKDRLSGQEVALKSLRFDLYSDTAFHGLNQRVQLANEFKWLASLRHPNIVSVIDYGFDLIAQPYFTMELLRGCQNIVDFCYNKPLHNRLAILGQVLHALAYLHRRNVIHRDLKSSNVLVHREQAKLLDFGLVALRGQESENSDTVVGTLAYMPPETLMGEAPAVSSDLYSFGVLAFYALTGELPFQNDDNRKLTYDIIHTPVDFSGHILPEDLRIILGRLLLKSPDQRYETAHDVIMAMNQVGASIPVETQQIRESYLKAAAFIGRKSEMSKLKMMLMGLNDKAGASCLIAGESGIGKSRLIQELRTYALTRGLTILESEASSHQLAPYYLWHNILRRLRLEVDMDEREEALVDSILGAGTNPLENIQARLLNFLMKQLLGQDAVLLILEDIHWADEASLALLSQLLPRIEHLPVMLVATYSTDQNPNLAKQLGAIDELRLERFEMRDIQDLTEAILGYSDKGLIDLLVQETEGNLYFLVEVLRTLAEKAGTLAQIAHIERQSRIITGGIRGIIENRIKRIPPKHIETLQIAALAGRTVDTNLMGQMTEDLDGFLQACESAAILQVSNNRWVFSHNKLREILEESILPYHKRELHQRLALELERMYKDEFAAALAYHSREAQDEERELRYSINAAELAFKVFSLTDAIHYYERAIQLGIKHGMGVATIIRLYQQLGRAFELSNQVEMAEQCYTAELDFAERRGLDTLRLNAIVNFACLYNSPNRLFDNQKGRHYINEGLEIAESIGNQREEARLYWASMLSNIYSDANTLRAVDDGLRSLRLAQEVGDERLIAFTLHDLSRAYLFEADFERGRTLMEKACELWQHLDHLPMLSDGYSILSIVDTFLGDYEKALHFSKRAYALAIEIDSDWGRAAALSFVGTIYMEDGKLQTAVETMQKCLRYSEEVGNHIPLVLTRSELALAHLVQGDVDTALNTAQLALELANNQQHYHMLEISPKAILAHIHCTIGNLEEAKQILDSINPTEFSLLMSPSALRLIAETRILLAIYEKNADEALGLAQGFLLEMQRLGLKSQFPHAHRLVDEVFKLMGKRTA